MRSLALFFWKNNFSLLFLLLEFIAYALVFRHNSYQRAGFLNSSNAMAGSVYGLFNNLTGYIRLRSINEELSLENAILRSQSLSARENLILNRNQILNKDFRQKYEYFSCKALNNSVNHRNNYLTLNRGSAQGIKPDMAVISSLGVVGMIKDVSENFSSVMSVLHKDSRISSKIKKDGAIGPLMWEGEDYHLATLKDIPTHVKLSKGDTIITSQYSSSFPEGILIGTVEGFERKPGETFYTVSVRLSNDFSKLNYLFVVTNLMKEEQDALEKTSQKE